MNKRIWLALILAVPTFFVGSVLIAVISPVSPTYASLWWRGISLVLLSVSFGALISIILWEPKSKMKAYKKPKRRRKEPAAASKT